MSEVARSTDQHTIVLGHIGTLAVNPYIFAKLPYDANKDFKPVSLLAKVPSLYVVHPDVPAKNLKEFIAYAKSKPGKLSYGSAGNGQRRPPGLRVPEDDGRRVHAARALPRHRPDGDRPALGPARRLGHRRGGHHSVHQGRQGALHCHRLDQAAAAIARRATVAEQGFPGFEMTQWYGMLAPANFAPANLAKLSAETMKAVKSPDSMQRLTGDAAEAVGSTPEQFAQFIAAEQARWQKVIARANIKPD
jgi:tripartite-type tricarboxylate transporter receptor subunit TctC